MGETAKVRQIDCGKNLKIRAVALDFDLITRNIEMTRQLDTIENETKDDSKDIRLENVKPDSTLLQNMASLLGVKLPGSIGGPSKDRLQPDGDDDLSLLNGMISEGKDPIESNSDIKDRKKDTNTRAPPATDVRLKYAQKLREKTDGGLSGLIRTKSEQVEVSNKGDAAAGHIQAREIVASGLGKVRPPTEGYAAGPNRWMATTGTGSLLIYLSSRSMKIALVPTPGDSTATLSDEVGRNMLSLSKQLPQIQFASMVSGPPTVLRSAEKVIDAVVDSLAILPSSTLLVSDSDALLRTGKEVGMLTCRVRPPNARRGDVTAHYTVEDVEGVHDIINEINGISFKTVLSSSR